MLGKGSGCGYARSEGKGRGVVGGGGTRLDGSREGGARGCKEVVEGDKRTISNQVVVPAGRRQIDDHRGYSLRVSECGFAQ